MHIMEGFLPVEHAIGRSVASAPFVAYGIHSIKKRIATNPEQRMPAWPSSPINVAEATNAPLDMTAAVVEATHYRHRYLRISIRGEPACAGNDATEFAAPCAIRFRAGKQFH
jgi:hypothetical protein